MALAIGAKGYHRLALVTAHQAAETDHIGNKNRGQLSFEFLLDHIF